jgi:hypothetical protein
MDWHLLRAELEGGLVPGVATDDDTVGIDDSWLAKPELADRRRDCIDGGSVGARFPFVWRDPIDGPEFHFHRSAP